MAETLKGAMRAVRDGWESCDSFDRRVHIAACTMVYGVLALTAALVPRWNLLVGVCFALLVGVAVYSCLSMIANNRSD